MCPQEMTALYNQLMRANPERAERIARMEAGEDIELGSSLRRFDTPTSIFFEVVPDKVDDKEQAPTTSENT